MGTKNMGIQTPDWVKHAVFYQIFPDRFARTQRQSLPPQMLVPLQLWDAPPTLQGYKGGDLWGVMEQLDYLQDLGITALYLNPIFQSASVHRYHTHDFYQVDPLLGGNPALFDLLEAAHKRGMRVILDGVFNHASRGFFFFNDILENGPHSPWLDWFRVEDWPLSAYDGAKPANYEGWWDNRALPEFNHDNPQVREYIMQIGEYWIRQGIDGWRLDIPQEITAAGFWQEFRQRIRAINPEAYIVGEIWTDARQWLDGTQFDGVMNYLFTGPTLAFAAQDRVVMPLVKVPEYYPYPALDGAGYGAKITELLDLYDWEIQQAQLNLLSSHDVARALSVVDEDQTSLELAALLQFTFPGAPCIYYGDEVGLAGGLDPDCRRGFPTPDQWNQSLLQVHKDLIQLRHRYRTLRTGDYQILATKGEGYAFSRRLEGEGASPETLIVAVNAGEAAIALQLPIQASAEPEVVYGNGKWGRQAGGAIAVTLPPRTGSVCHLDSVG